MSADRSVSSPYAPPLDLLLALDFPETTWEETDYVALGIGPEHVDELIRMALDQELPALEEPECYATFHAARALAQLRAEAAVEPMVELIRRPEFEEDDWLLEDVPSVLARIGPPATGALLGLLDEAELDSVTYVAMTTAVRDLALRHPSERGAVVAALLRELENPATGDEMAGFLVASLVDLDAVEAAPALERAFGERRVAVWVAGDWEDVQVSLGLLEKRLTPRPRYVDPQLTRHHDWEPEYQPAPASDGRAAAKKAKAKKKREKASRRKNRRK